MGTSEIIHNPVWNCGKACVYCGSPNTHIHHIFFGAANRKKADSWGYVIPLCREHHLGANGIHRNRGMDLRWKELAQRHYEEHHGSRANFIKEFGRSYL